MKTTHDKVNSGLGKVCLVEQRLREKKWDATGPPKFLQDETTKVKNQNSKLHDSWAKASTLAATLKSKPDTDIDADALSVKANEYEAQAAKLVAAYKLHSKDCLQEFAKSSSK
eukprot:4628664-Pyramimonas_sp.AAC.1